MQKRDSIQRGYRLGLDDGWGKQLVSLPLSIICLGSNAVSPGGARQSHLFAFVSLSYDVDFLALDTSDTDGKVESLEESQA